MTSYQEAKRLGVVVIEGVRVAASGGYDTQTWKSTGIGYAVEIDSPAPPVQAEAVQTAVDSVAEIPKSIRAGATVERLRA